MSNEKETSSVIFSERFLFPTVYFSLGKNRSHIPTLLMLQFQIFTIFRIPYVPHQLNKYLLHAWHCVRCWGNKTKHNSSLPEM